MGELYPLAYSTDILFHLITNNINSPVLAEIQYLSLSKLNTKQMATLLPALAKMIDLTSLALPQCKPTPDHFKFIFTECPALSKLQSLDFEAMENLMSEDLHLLSQSTTLINLTSLNLRSSNATISRVEDQGWPTKDASGLIALLSSPVVKNLTHSRFGCTSFDDPRVFIAIATSPFLSNIVSRDLSENLIRPASVAALAASTTLTNLTHLNLSWTYLGDDLIAQLFSPPSLLATKLQCLNLTRSDMTVSSLEVVLKACPSLTELILESNSLGSTGAALVAASMPKLIKLNLAGCNIGDDGYAALAASTTLTNLRELNPSWARVGAASVIALINSPVMANLTHLDLSCTNSGPEVLIAIAQSPSMSKLQHLGLSRNEVGDEGVTALSQSTTSTNLVSLDLGWNNIGPDGIEALCTSPIASKLTSLHLAYIKDLGNSVASVLAAPSSTLNSLLELNLEGTGMDDDGMLQVLKTPNLDQLNVLDVYGNNTTSSAKSVYCARFRVIEQDDDDEE
jgi:hypothetical protein